MTPNPSGRDEWNPERQRSGTAVMGLLAGAIRNRRSSRVVTQSAPSPNAIDLGSPLNPPIVSTTLRERPSIRVTVPSPSFATQIEPPPAAIEVGLWPTGMAATSLFVFGSIAPTALGGRRRRLSP